jgi:Tfp pilus assembly protein PilF
MSLLMQALKKAEHSKQKKDVPVAATSPELPTAAATRFEELSLSPIFEREIPAVLADTKSGFEPDGGDGGMHIAGADDLHPSSSSLPMPEQEIQVRHGTHPSHEDGASDAMSPVHYPAPETEATSQAGQATASISTTNSIAAQAESVPATPAAQTRRDAESARASINAARQAEEARKTAKTVFVAKQAPPRRRILVLVSSAVLLATAGVGGYYVWQTTMQPSGLFPAAAPAPVVAVAGPVVPPAAVATAEPVVATFAVTEPVAAPTGNPGAASGQRTLPGTASVDSQHASLSGRMEKTEAAPVATTAAVAAKDVVAAADEKSPIRIQHTSNVSRLNPALARGYDLFQRGDIDAARQQYQIALRQEPHNRDALLGMAAIAVDRQQSAVAVDYYSKLLELDPSDPDAIAGLISEQQGDPAQSESRLKKVLSTDPQASQVLFALGNLYAQQSRWADAQQVYFRAYVTAPENANFAFNLAVSLDKLGQRKLALEYYRKALALKDGNFDGVAVRRRADELQAILSNQGG